MKIELEKLEHHLAMESLRATVMDLKRGIEERRLNDTALFAAYTRESGQNVEEWHDPRDNQPKLTTFTGPSGFKLENLNVRSDVAALGPQCPRKGHECADDPPATPFEVEASSTGRPGRGRRSSLLWGHLIRGPRASRSCQPPMGKPISLWKPWAPKDRASHKLVRKGSVLPIREAFYSTSAMTLEWLGWWGFSPTSFSDDFSHATHNNNDDHGDTTRPALQEQQSIIKPDKEDTTALSQPLSWRRNIGSGVSTEDTSILTTVLYCCCIVDLVGRYPRCGGGARRNKRKRKGCVSSWAC
ncbi:hypothetical protein WN48_04491 [Eufriesea mexicana]|nr:hypothetical protein WN48_04491 [Eufriesea mexicana]